MFALFSNYGSSLGLPYVAVLFLDSDAPIDQR